MWNIFTQAVIEKDDMINNISTKSIDHLSEYREKNIGIYQLLL